MPFRMSAFRPSAKPQLPFLGQVALEPERAVDSDKRRGSSPPDSMLPRPKRLAIGVRRQATLVAQPRSADCNLGKHGDDRILAPAGDTHTDASQPARPRVRLELSHFVQACTTAPGCPPRRGSLKQADKSKAFPTGAKWKIVSSYAANFHHDEKYASAKHRPNPRRPSFQRAHARGDCSTQRSSKLGRGPCRRKLRAVPPGDDDP